MERPFAQVDVFTSEPLLGNPVAVVLDGTGLSTEQMQAFTDWTNLSEATFIVPSSDPSADYAVRIFCPGRELPFAGHPTLGTCHAWLEAGGVPKADVIVQECGVGLVHIRLDRSSGALAFAAPPLIRSGPLAQADVDRIVAALGIAADDVVAHQWCDNGPGWQALMLRSAADVLAVRPDPALMSGLFVGIVGPSDAEADADVEVRAFFPGNGGVVAEDPVTGSLNAALAQWLIPAGTLPESYVAAQGTALRRAGRVRIASVDGQVWVGGSCMSVLTGAARIEA